MNLNDHSVHDHSEDSVEEQIFFEADKTVEELKFEDALEVEVKLLIEKDIHRNRCKAKIIGKLLLKQPA